MSLELKYTEKTPTLDTNVYASGDALGTEMVLSDVMGVNGAMLESIVLIDKADQGVDLDILFFAENPTDQSDNAAINYSDADSDKYIGHVSISGSSDYVDLVNNKCAIKKDLKIPLIPNNTEGKIYVHLVSRGTPTYAASSLVLKFGVRKL